MKKKKITQDQLKFWGNTLLGVIFLVVGIWVIKTNMGYFQDLNTLSNSLPETHRFWYLAILVFFVFLIGMFFLFSAQTYFKGIYEEI